MKRMVGFTVVLFCLAAPALWAQSSGGDHIELGAFADYFRLSQVEPAINFVGIGGRFGFYLTPKVSLEAEMAYDFRRNFTTTFSNGITTQFATVRTRPLTGLFGPKFQTPGRAFHLCATGKVGFINFNSTISSGTAGFTSSVNSITSGDTRFALYPGGGAEFFLGPVGLRAEVGDEIYFDNGGRNNLRVTFGPQIRF